jgi:hypothetical protein
MDGRPGLLTRRPTCLAGLITVCAALTWIPGAGAQGPAVRGRQGERTSQTQRMEGEAILALADAALEGKPVPADFRISWQNEFLKAQRGTFVPFTLTVDVSRMSRPSALVYVRAVRQRDRDAQSSRRDRRQRDRDDDSEPGADFPLDAIFPVALEQEPGQIARIHRGFSLAPGRYDVFVVVQERLEPAAPDVRPRASVLRQALSVPDFWSGELTTSTVILADRLDVLSKPLNPDQLSDRPYVIGQNEITPAADRRFRRDEELIVIFLVYNPTVTSDRHYDLQVEYHFFRKVAGTPERSVRSLPSDRPPELEGETYFNHTEPQRFNASNTGAPEDAGAVPVVAGQGVPLGAFEPGDYRLAIRISDLLSGKSVLRDVLFTVAP